MNFKDLSDKEKQHYAEIMLSPLSSSQDIKDWAQLFLGLELPLEITDPESTSSPLDAIWQVYNTFKTNSGDKNPGYIMLSCREGMKCQIRGTKLLTYNGYKNIEDVLIGDIVWTGFSWQKVTNFFDEGMKPSLKVSLEGGHVATGTPIHRYWCLRNGKEQWIASKDLNIETDLVCLNTNTEIKNSTVKDQEKYEIGYFLGLMIGDGCLTLMNEYNRVSLTTADVYIKNFFYYFNEKYLGNKSIYTNKYDLKISSKDVCGLLKDWGLKNCYSWEKTIPKFVYYSHDSMKGFIAGLFDSDGCWDKKGDCFFEMTAGPLLDQVQTVLVSFGIESKIRHNKKLYGLQKHLVSRLTIGQTESAKFEKLGIEFKAKKAQSHKINKIPNCKDVLPKNQLDDLLLMCNRYNSIHLRNRKCLKPILNLKQQHSGITYYKLNKLIEWMEENIENNLVDLEDIKITKRYKQILLNKWKKFTVTDTGEQYFYDLTVENEHSYWSNGLISHNTVSVAILEILLLIHFQLEIGHAASIETQSSVALQYIGNFILSIEPLLDAAGWEKISENKRFIQYKTPQNQQPFIKIIICSKKGMNSLHSNILLIDETDLADPQALKEGQNITGFSKGIHGVTVYLSTRKYAFGNMAAAIEKAPEMNYKILRWNILDVTESCSPSRHRPELPREDRYVAKNLPLKQLSKEEFESIADQEKLKYDLIKNAYNGCKDCNLLPVCRMRLSEKPKTATGGFYKPISTVQQAFRKNDPDIAESQLMCWRPGSEGLVYPRFNSEINKGNIIEIKQAYETLIGPTKKNVSEIDLLYEMQKAGTRFVAGVDWGYTHDFVIIVLAIIPNGEVWVIDCYAAPGLEFADQLEVAKTYRDKYKIQKWFCDTAMPAHLKSFNKNGMKSPSFQKDVLGGIEAIRSKITDGSGRKLFKVIKTDATRKVITAILKHRFKIDGQGNPTMNPDDERGVADICDALRYVGQNEFPVKGPQKPSVSWTDMEQKGQQNQSPEATEMMKREIADRLGTDGIVRGGSGKKGGFHFNF